MIFDMKAPFLEIKGECLILGYPFIAITPKFTLNQSGSTYQGPI